MMSLGRMNTLVYHFFPPGYFYPRFSAGTPHEAHSPTLKMGNENV